MAPPPPPSILKNGSTLPDDRPSAGSRCILPSSGNAVVCGLKSSNHAHAAVGPMERCGPRAGQRHNAVEGLDAFQDGRVFLAGVSKSHDPFDGRKIAEFHAHATDDQPASSGRCTSRCVRSFGRQCFARNARSANCPRVWRAGCRRRRRKTAARCRMPDALPKQRQIGQPQRAAVGQLHLGVGPIRLIAGDAVAAVAHFERERRSLRRGRPARVWPAFPPSSGRSRTPSSHRPTPKRQPSRGRWRCLHF